MNSTSIQLSIKVFMVNLVSFVLFSFHILVVNDILLALYISIYHVLSVSEAAVQPLAVRALYLINNFIIIIIM